MAVLVGKKAPAFVETAVVNGGEVDTNFTLSQFEGRKYVLFFFYPLDFTSVCNSELVAFQQSLSDFEVRDVQVVGCSVDSHYSHQAWLKMPLAQGGIQGITYPLVADFSKSIANNYGVLAGDWDYNEQGELAFEGKPMAYRGSFLIDLEGIVRHQVVNDLPLGRSVGEALRMVDALQHFDQNGEDCPANWKREI
ncbi:MAG: peroxiredoxin [Bacteroidia bacterium]|nr:peroxiredoxin [Bacteroidia bacterium]